MPENYKVVNDCSLSDVNRANRDAWDSGEFRHEDAWPESASRAAENGAPFKQAVGPLTKAQAEYGEKRKKDLRSIGISPIEGETINRRAVISRHPQNDTSTVIEDSTPQERTARKEANLGKISQELGKVSRKGVARQLKGEEPGYNRQERVAMINEERLGRRHFGDEDSEDVNTEDVSGEKDAIVGNNEPTKSNKSPKFDTAKYEKQKNEKFEEISKLLERRREREETEDVRHPKAGASQQVFRGKQVVAQHDEEKPKRQVHMPRTAKRTWRKGEWS